MKAPIKRRLKLAAVLSPALFLLMIWQLVLNPEPYVSMVGGLVPAVALAAGVAATAAYVITLFLAELRGEP